MTLVQYINVYLDVFCILVDLIILTVMYTSEYRKEKLNKVFLWMIVGNLLMLVCDLIICLSGDKADTVTHLILIVAHVLIFCSGPIVTIGFAYYVAVFLRQKGTASKMLTIATYAAIIPCITDILFCVINPFNGIYYTLDASNNAFYRNDLFLLSQVFSFVSILVITGIIIAYRKKLEKREMLFLLSYSIFPVVALLISLVVLGSGMIYHAITLSILMYYTGIQSEQAKKLKQKELELSESRIDIMLTQIQPHFLYNTLATIEVLCHDDSTAAAKMVHDFSNYLRKNMDSLTQKELVDFNREIEHIKIYLDIEKLRLRERLTIVYDLGVTDFQLPILTVQPLVENAVRYGVSKKRFGGTVTISTCHVPDGVKIIISDDGIGFDSTNPKQQDERSHIGIENVRERLRSQCVGTLTIESEIGKGTVCTIIVPQGGMRT